MNGDKIPIGKCSQCGGIVSRSMYLHTVNRPIGICESCGAHEDIVTNLPVIPTKGPFNKNDPSTKEIEERYKEEFKKRFNTLVAQSNRFSNKKLS